MERFYRLIQTINQKEENLMFIKKIITRAAGPSLAAISLLTVQPLRAQSASDSARLEKLEHAVELLEKQNAQLQAEINSLKSKHSAPAPAAVAEGKTKSQVTYDGKSYVEKLVPDLGGSKWKLFPAITELELFGDARLRYEYRGGRTDDTPVAAPSPGVAGTHDWQERERERYRLRIGLRGTVLDDWFFGLRLETSSSARSTNVTMGGDASNGPFNKGDDGIAVGQVYLGYRGFPGFTFTGGRFANPFVTTSLVWDEDINPEGLAEQWKHTFTFGGGEPPPPTYSKDGKAIAAGPPAEPFLKLDLFANFGQFVYDDANPENPLGPRAVTHQITTGVTQLTPNTDAFLLGWQLGARFEFPHILYFQLAPALYNYTGNGDTFNIFFQGGDPNVTNAVSLAQNQTGINSLLVFDIPAEIGWKVWNIPMRIFGDFAMNFEADDRAVAAGHPGKGGDRYAYATGLDIGQLKKKRDWEIRAWWQHTDQYAVDPNLVDSDLFDSRVNMEGVGVKAGYMLADAIVLNLTYGYGWQADDSLGTGGTGDLGINPLNQYQLFQADLSVKF
jgi:putative porin